MRASRKETADTRTLELAPCGGGPAPEFRPGQFNMLYLPGLGEAAISISGQGASTLLHTVRAAGPVTQALAGLRRGDELGLRGPYGRGWPVEEAASGDVVVMAGGLGLPPLRPAVQALLSRRGGGRLSVLYGARSPAELMFRRDLAAWKRAGADVAFTVDRAEGGWRGRVGVVTTLLEGRSFEMGRTTAFVCGPELMMRICASQLAARGVAKDRIFLSMERNMKCAVGFCGHCQLGPDFLCKDGPVLGYGRIEERLGTRGL